MAKETATSRIDRGNQLVDALKAETDRGRACVGDALLDELIKEMFSTRLAGTKAEIKEVLGDGQLLGNHGGRLKLAYLLGWIGPETYSECRAVHKIRNRMAHNLDVDSFAHSGVRDLIDALKSPRDLTIGTKNGIKRVNLKRREDKFLIAVQMSVLRCWWFVDHGEHLDQAGDPPINRLPKPGGEPSGHKQGKYS
jgi:DNA-binding MltR family transcriptional regulator